ncbi:hypothetical protein LOC68_15730 [Blastopirellula sp. JC732]|uniref:Transmembrane protein n=1 Tax=Blastopirellula sediminis TaxID=2894196 RepID=A0A9X1MP83_9BACT|nr:hypothetical protein [Blastopirellula sediminis]MCC9606864.1 hypothetical protein [Blastopirellula sediminis]MCC9629840.1 hypothetical protein [Blastopirellula sediminis]
MLVSALDLQKLLFKVMFLAFVFSLLLGLLAIFVALLRRSQAAKALGSFCVAVGLVAGILPGVMYVPFTTPLLLVPLAIPALLGAAALGINRYYKDLPPLTGFQFPLPALIFVTLLVASIAGLYKAGQRAYFYNRDQALANFQRMPAIESVVVHGRPDPDLFEFWVEEIEFSLVGRPETRIRLAANYSLRHCDSDQPLEQLTIKQIGPWTFGGQGMISTTSADGQPRRKKVSIGDLSLGVDGPLRSLIPLKIESVDDIVANYDKLVELLESWPRVETPGRLELEDQVIEYWVTEVDSVPAP